jgi:hypothetical protein
MRKERAGFQEMDEIFLCCVLSSRLKKWIGLTDHFSLPAGCRDGVTLTYHPISGEAQLLSRHLRRELRMGFPKIQTCPRRPTPKPKD